MMWCYRESAVGEGDGRRGDSACTIVGDDVHVLYIRNMN